MGNQKFGEDEYLEFAKYQGHPKSKETPRFSTFTYQDHYFFTLLNKGKAFMMSEGYATEKSRDNGMESVLKNCDIPERWFIVEEDNNTVLVLKAGNHKEIARSDIFRSKAKAESMKNTFLNLVDSSSAKQEEKEDDYLPTKFYEGHPIKDKTNNVAMFTHTDGQFYFVLYHNDGSVKIRSEGFETALNRGKELSAVIKHHNNADRYQIIRKGKYHMMVLKDEDGTEIGRSPLQVDDLKQAKATNEGTTENTTDSSDRLAATSAVAGTVATGAGLTSGGGNKSSKTSSSNDEYLPVNEYKNRGEKSSNKNFTSFTHDAHHYFALHSNTGEVKLRSQAYKSEKARDNGMESVMKNMTIEKHWSVLEENGKFYSILKAANHQEIGRSGAYQNKAAASWTPLTTTVAAASAAGINTGTSSGKTDKTTKGTNPVDKVSTSKEDDYLVCSAYENHKVNDKVNNVALFKHSNGQYYFALYGKEGNVRLRSEGFETANKRDEELSAVLKLKNNKSMYTREEPRKGFFYDVLKDKAGREVGRSCLQQIKNKTAAGTNTKTAATAVAAASSAVVVNKAKSTNHVSEVRTEKYVSAKRKTGVVRETVSYKEGVTQYAAPAAGDLNLAKFWWIPLLLLLIPLLFLAWNWMNPSTVVSSVTPPPVQEQIVEQAVVPPPVKAVPPPVAPTPRCKCEDLNHYIFTIPGGPAPKTTTALGSAPEYGDLHSLDANGFYNKLKSKYASSGSEKRFLDAIFKQMGYDGGFADATAGMFTAVTVPRGVSGNLGTKRDHQTVHRKLDPINARDLEAFRIKAKNTCDLHFMKTCGNHFFFKECDTNS